MKKGVLTAFCGVVIYAAFTIGCMDRTPAPVCPVPTEINQTDFRATGFDGVDLLVVVDDSKSMEVEQKILATGFFTLINSLVNPITGSDHPPVDNLRVAVVSSDMGLQYGANGSIDESTGNVTECPGRGKNGEFQPPQGGTIDVTSDVIACEVGGNQCPCDTGRTGCDGSEWTCTNGTCSGPTDEVSVNCPSTLWGLEEWAENAEGDNLDIAREVACMSNLGIGGCPFEQQLEASVKGLSTHAGFIKDDHVLAVLVVSDEEDCSIEDNALFSTPEWDYSDQGIWVNVACGWEMGTPGQANDDKYLFPTSRYLQQWTNLKGGAPGGVVFAAIVGVPAKNVCEGSGNLLMNCLEDDEMQYGLRQNSGSDQNFFAYACTRGDETEAAPGRRYVQVAQEFQENGYVYSICNADWSPAMAAIANLIAVAVGASCYEDSLAWVPLSQADQEAEECPGCGTAICNMVYEYDFDCEAEEELKACEERILATNPACPAFFERPQDEALQYEMVDEVDENGEKKLVLDCIAPKLAAPFSCTKADPMHQGTEEFGWYYCENLGSGDAEVDGGAEETCRVGINFSASAEEESATHGVKIQCLQEFTFEDPNCQENTAQACNDDIDNDGNGVWDCNGDMSGENPHRADRNCCVVDDRCEINPISYGADGICPDNSNSPGNHSDACITQVLRCCLQNVDDVDGGRPEICDLIEAELRSESE